MSTMLEWNDTIVALATPPGIGAIGVIRLSGKKSFEIVNFLFTSKDLLQQPSHTVHVGLLKEDNNLIDEVMITLFKGPRSYTGEDVIEISCHGSPYIHKQVIEACLNKGARVAKPGEFTQRAFIYGKLDLTQAEAVADLILSNTGASHKSSLQNIRGGFSKVLKDLREQLIKFSALIELELDFSQEDIEFADRSLLLEILTNAKQTISSLLSSFKLGNVIKNGVQVAIVGKPNAGKSTLLNTLLNENRAIVSEIAGTTRDTIEEVINIAGILFRLIDTAGIREHTSGSIESMGIEKSLEKIEQSDIVLYLFDMNTMAEEELRAIALKLKQDGRNFLLVANKADLIINHQSIQEFYNNQDILFISAKVNEHIEELKNHLAEMVLQGSVQTEDVIITNARHYYALKEMNTSIQDILLALVNNVPGDLVALDIRRCLHFLGEITGEITNEDQLNYIFSKFCIGK